MDTRAKNCQHLRTGILVRRGPAFVHGQCVRRCNTVFISLCLFQYSAEITAAGHSKNIYQYRIKSNLPSSYCPRKQEQELQRTYRQHGELIVECRARIYKEEFYSREFYYGHLNTLSTGRGEGPHMRSERCTLQSRTLQLYRFEPREFYAKCTQ